MEKVPVFWRYVIVMLISMVPIIELRGSVPIGIGWGLEAVPTYLLCVLGNFIPVPFILLFVRSMLKFMLRVKWLAPIAEWVQAKADKHSGAITKYATFGLFLFVAIPLPGTGAWTGSLVAALLNMKMKYALISVFLGIVTAGLIMTLGSELVALIMAQF